MKKFVSLLLPFSFAMLLLSSACNNPNKETPKKEASAKIDSLKKDTIKPQAYVCKMGAQCGQSDQPGKCPNCGMDMDPNPDFHKK
jgi:hypothetical protein